jgi:hypothetical protein
MGVWITIAAVGLTSALVMLIVGLRAPEGYEDEEGFHYGPTPPYEPSSDEAEAVEQRGANETECD